MKKGLIYFLGVITGVVLTFLTIFFIASDMSGNGNSSDNGITIFPEPGDCISKKQFEVFQVMESGAALAREESYKDWSGSLYLGMVVLFMNDEGKYHYDDEIIEVPSGKCVRQIGIYKYTTKDGEHKTVPIVKIME